MEATTWKWLNERTKGHTRQFDLIAWRSARRFEVEEKRSELASKRDVVDRLLKDLNKTQKQLEEFRGQVRDIERNLEQSLAAAKHRIRDDSPAVSTKLLSLNQGLASARENLQGFEAAALAANEQAQILLLDLRTTEAKVCAHLNVPFYATQAQTVAERYSPLRGTRPLVAPFNTRASTTKEGSEAATPWA
jgi:chromosome segregation ATPase